jgi:hypothetical protein
MDYTNSGSVDGNSSPRILAPAYCMAFTINSVSHSSAYRYNYFHKDY